MKDTKFKTKVIDMVSWYVVTDFETSHQYFAGPLSYEQAIECINSNFNIPDLKLASTLTTNMVLVEL